MYFPMLPLGVIFLENEKISFQYSSHPLGSDMPHKRSMPPHQHVKNHGVTELLFLMGMSFPFVGLEQEK